MAGAIGGTAAEGDDRRVLHQQQGRFAAGFDKGVLVLLALPSGAVAEKAEVEDTHVIPVDATAEAVDFSRLTAAVY